MSDKTSLGDNDFEKLLIARLKEHQEGLNQHSMNIRQKIEWLSPTRTGEKPADFKDIINIFSHEYEPKGGDPATDHAESGSDPQFSHRPGSSSVTPRGAMFGSDRVVPQGSVRRTATSMNGSNSNLHGNSGHPPAAQGRLSRNSEKLAQRRRAEEGVSGMDIVQSMELRHDRSRAEKWLRAQLLAEAEVPGKPVLSERAAALPPSSVDEVVERLHSGGKPSVAANMKLLEALKLELQGIVDANLTDTSFRPRITPRAHQLQRRANHTAHDDLYEQAVIQQRHKDQLMEQRRRHREEELRARAPSLNPMSAAIAEGLSEAPMERLTRRSATPAVSDAEQRSQSRRSYSTARTEQLFRDHIRRQAKQLAAAHESTHLPSDCTFKPHINSAGSSTSFGRSGAPAAILRGLGGNDDVSSSAPIVDRLEAWDQRRKQRIAEEQTRKSKSALDGCTFAPNINVSVAAPDQPEVHPGFIEFISRHEIARDRKLDLAAALSFRGSHVAFQDPGAAAVGDIASMRSPPRTVHLQRSSGLDGLKLGRSASADTQSSVPSAGPLTLAPQTSDEASARASVMQRAAEALSRARDVSSRKND